MESVMPFCVAVLESTVDTLVSLIAAAMTLVAALVDPPSAPPGAATTPAYALISFEAGQDVDMDGLIAQLRAGDPGRRAMAACELEELGSGARRAIAALVERLSDGSPVDPKICGEDRHYWSKDIEQQTTPGEEAAAALVAIGSESLPSLVTAARAPQWVARRNAVWALGALDDQRGVAPVRVALEDREPPVRRVAAWALGALEADIAVPALVAALRDEDASVRKQVAWALGAIDDRRAVDGLIAALKDQDEGVRTQAAWALGAIGDSRATSAVAAALKDASPSVRRQAAWALGAIGR
jgi:HEAT repeat protein